jgi:hypothetical protein
MIVTVLTEDAASRQVLFGSKSKSSVATDLGAGSRLRINVWVSTGISKGQKAQSNPRQCENKNPVT